MRIGYLPITLYLFHLGPLKILDTVHLHRYYACSGKCLPFCKYESVHQPRNFKTHTIT